MSENKKEQGLTVDQAAAKIKFDINPGNEEITNKDVERYINLPDGSESEKEEAPSKELSLDQAADEIKDLLKPKQAEPETATEQHDEPDEPLPQPQAHPYRKDITEAATAWQREAQQFDAVVNSIDWQKLQQMNPGEFAARRQEFIEQRSALQARADAIRQANQQVTAEEQTLLTGHVQKLIQREHNRMIKVIPEWKNETVRNREKQALKGYLHAQGFTDQEIAGIYDHRQVKVLYQAFKATQPETSRKIPKIQLKQKGEQQSPEALADREIRKRNLSETSTEAAAIRIRRMGLAR